MVNRLLLTKVGSRGTRSSFVEIDKKSSPSPSSSRWGKSWRSGSRSGHSDKTLDPLCTTWRRIKDHPRCHTSSSVSQSHLSSRPSVSGCGLLANRSKFLEQKQSSVTFFFFSSLSLSLSLFFLSILYVRGFSNRRALFAGSFSILEGIDPRGKVSTLLNEELMSSRWWVRDRILFAFSFEKIKEKKEKGRKEGVYSGL